MKKKYTVALFLFLTLFVIFFTALPTSQKLFAQTESCVSAKCHASMGKDKVVHNPVKEGMCTKCHQAADDPEKKSKHPGNLKITLVKTGADLCNQCHEPKNKKKVVHAPIQGGACTSCHNPHQSPNKGLLKETMPKLCFHCHQEDLMKHKVMHPPVAAGDCSGCHDNHQSDFPGRLVQPGNALCFTCHPKVQDGLKSKKVAHQPAKQSCLQCHNPHGSPQKGMLNAPVPALCSNCHPSEASLTERALVKHGPMSDAKACLNCHSPHFSEQAKLLTAAEKELCIECHNKELDVDSSKIKDLKAFLEANKGGQGPLKGKSCSACHNPHGSEYWRLLAKYYVPTFYASYSNGKYSMCFSCHAKEAFTERKTDTATKFRDGNKNLHFVHVNKLDKGRTCRACHEVCAECESTGAPKHVKDMIGFSYWKMPMNFSLSANGGSCAPGCHGEKQYSR